MYKSNRNENTYTLAQFVFFVITQVDRLIYGVYWNKSHVYMFTTVFRHWSYENRMMEVRVLA